MIDFHCHFLPQIDDGAGSVEESVWILNELKGQNIDTVCATPHFNGEKTDIEDFLQNRQAAFEKVKPFAKDINIVLGAEVLITPRLLKIKEMKRLCAGGSRCILLEMPYGPWQQWMFDVVLRAEEMNLIPVIAHPERYYEGNSLFKYTRFFKMEKIYMQFNADTFLSMRGRGTVKKILKNETVLPIMGSDAHNKTWRKPKIEAANKKILRCFGEEIYRKFENNAKIIL